MNMETVFQRLIERIDTLERVVRRQSVRINNMVREGAVTEVDYEKGLVTVDAHGVEAKPASWSEQAGDINEWTPPSVGQRVLLISPDGDPGKAVIMRGGFTDEVPQPHNKGAEKRVRIGGCTITQTGSEIRFEVGGCTFVFDGSGFTQTGGKMEHDGRNVGTDHIHGGVDPGDSDTDVPSN